MGTPFCQSVDFVFRRVLADVFGKKGDKAFRTLEGKAWYNRAWQAFKDAWKGLLTRMGMNRADLSKVDRMSNEEFMKFLDDTMAEGKTLGRLEKGAGQLEQIATSGVQSQPISEPSGRTPTQIDPNAGQRLASLANIISENGAFGAEDFLKNLSTTLGGAMDNVDKSVYFNNPSTGTDLILRIANHRGNAKTFGDRGEYDGNFGIVVKMSDQRFKKDPRVNYIEEVFFADRLTPEVESKIVRGLAEWAKSGVYNGPKGDITDMSIRTIDGGDEVVRKARAPAAPGSRILDDIQTKGEKFKEPVYRLVPESIPNKRTGRLSLPNSRASALEKSFSLFIPNENMI